MINVYYKEIIPQYCNSASYNSTSAKKIALSLIRGPQEDDVDTEPFVDQSLHHSEEKIGSIRTNAESELSGIKKLEEEIYELNKKMVQNSKALNQIESYIIDLNELKSKANDNCSKLELLYKVFEDWLLKRVDIQVNGSNIKGVLTEITHEYIKLVECECIVVIPISKIDFAKFQL